MPRFEKGNTAAKGRKTPPKVATLLARVSRQMADIQARLDQHEQQRDAQK